MQGRLGARCCPHDTRDADVAPQVSAGPPPGVAAREWDILQELGRGDEAQVGFQGIRRRLELHPEALRRALARMVRDGLVAKDALGYRLSEAGHDLVARHDGPRPPARTVPVAFLLTPSHLTPERVVAALARRWFEGLHWYGLAGGAGERTLTWLTDGDDRPVRLRVGLAGIRVEAALDDDDPDPRLRAVAPLLAALSELLREAVPPGGAGEATRRDDAARFAA